MAYTGNLIPTMTSATAPSGVATSSGNYSATYAEWKAFDHLNTNSSGFLWLAPLGQTGWVGYEFVAAHVITQYAVTSINDTTTHAPKNFTFQGWNGTTWDTLDTQTNVTDWAASPIRHVYPIANSTSYTQYRLVVTTSTDATCCAVGELEMMEDAAAGGTVPLGLLHTRFFPPRGVIVHG